MKMIGLLATVLLLGVQACAEQPGDSQVSDTSGSIVSTLQAPGESITGLAWGDGSLWAVDSDTKTVYRMDPESGEVLMSFQCDIPPTYLTTGLAYSETNDMVLVGLWNYQYNGYVFQYSPQGEFLSSMSMCGG